MHYFRRHLTNMANSQTLYNCFLLVSFTAVALSTAGAARTRSRALYGEYCDNRSIRCDSSLSLTCKNQTCVCMKEENMINITSGACAVLVGERCRFTVLEEYRSWQEEIICVSHAHCTAQGICVCDKDYIELPNGTCIPKKGHNEMCTTTADCKQDMSLICLDGKCSCNPDKSEYSNLVMGCVGLANERCINDLCTSNAICREETRRLYYGSVEVEDSSDEEYAETTETLRDPASVGRCQCRTAFGVTAEKTCRLGYGGRCDHKQAKCMSWLKCQEGTCVCKYPTHQVYDKVTDSCLSQVGGPCSKPENGSDVNTTGSGCIRGAICANVPDTSRFQCNCPIGYVENRDRGCDLAYGQMCSTQQPHTYSTRQVSTSAVSPATSNAKCDKIGKLFCIDGFCQCEDDLHVYDQEIRSCKGRVGASCYVNLKNECIRFAICSGRRGIREGGGDSTSRKPDGICKCQENYKEVEDGSCTPKSTLLSSAQEKISGGISLKSADGGRERHNDEKFNATANSIWALFDDIEDV